MINQTRLNIIVGIILLIGGYVLVGDISLEPTHYCEEREIKTFCYSLSSTMKTCYTKMNKTGGKRCNVWKEIGKAEEEIKPIIPAYPKYNQWLCNQVECVPIN